MSWKNEFLVDERVLEIKFGIDFQPEELPDLLNEVKAQLAENQSLWVLADCSRLEKSSSLFKIYDFPKLYAAKGINRRTKEAVILPIVPKVREALIFYETVCRNLGLYVKAFDNRQDALEWLHQ